MTDEKSKSVAEVNGGKVATIRYRKVANSRPVYYSILETFGQSLQYVSIKFPPQNVLHCANVNYHDNDFAERSRDKFSGQFSPVTTGSAL